jgi:hypothetical protein
MGYVFSKISKRELVNAVKYLSKTGCLGYLLEFQSFKKLCVHFMYTCYEQWVVGGCWMDMVVQKPRLKVDELLIHMVICVPNFSNLSNSFQK